MTNTITHNSWPTSTDGRTAIRQALSVYWGESPYYDGMFVLCGLSDVLAQVDADSAPGTDVQSLFDSGDVTYGDVQYWYAVVSRYIDIAKANGHDG